MSKNNSHIKRKTLEPEEVEVPVKQRDVDRKVSELANSKVASVSPIKISLSAQPKPPEKTIKPTTKLKEVFNTDEESEEEEIPEEARIRMRNLGRFTPTSSGPNSYGKSRFGFIDRRALLNRQTEAINQIASSDDTS